MPNIRQPGEVTTLWRSFIRSLRSILSALPDHRHQDQFIRVKDSALDLAESDRMAMEVEHAYTRSFNSPNTPDMGDAAEIVVKELESYPMAVNVFVAEEKAGSAKDGAGKSLAKAAKTVLGSVSDVFEMTPFGKGVIAVVKEGIELVSGE